MSSPIANPTNTLVVNKSAADVNAAIAFIPALSSKYKLVNADPAQQRYTFSREEPSGAGVYIDIRYSANSENKTELTLAVRKKTGAFEKSRDVAKANRHLHTLVNLLSDSLRLEPGQKARLLSTKTNERTAGEHRRVQALKETTFSKKEQAFFRRKNLPALLICFFLLAALLYGWYRYLLR